MLTYILGEEKQSDNAAVRLFNTAEVHNVDVDEHEAAESKIELENTLVEQENFKADQRREKTEQMRLKLALQRGQALSEMQKGMIYEGYDGGCSENVG